MKDISEQLKHPQILASRNQVIGKTSIVPKVAGIYAWYFKDLPSKDIDYKNCWVQQDAYLLYVGISPRKPPRNGKPPSKETLRSRIRTHMRGNSSSSTLRYSIGCLLSQTMDIQLRRVGENERFHFSNGENVLSDWLEENALVTWISIDEPWLAEGNVISDLYLPLNLDHNKNHPFYENLTKSRKNSRERAKQLPVI